VLRDVRYCMQACLAASSLWLVGCAGPLAVHPPALTSGPSVAGVVLEVPPVRGRIQLAGERKTQALFSEVAANATVSLIDPVTGNTVSSSITDGSGNFVLTFSGFTPTAGHAYVIEAVKGLSVGGSQNRVGASLVRVRSILVYNAGWQSLTNSTVNTGIVLSDATTAVAAIAYLKALPQASLSALVNTVNGSAFNQTGTGLSNTSDFQPVLGLVDTAISVDQDPIAAIAFNPNGSSYFLATEIPILGHMTPSVPTPGAALTLVGMNFDRVSNRDTFYFGSSAVSSWSITADRSSLTLTVPAGAYSGPFTLQQPNGVATALSPFLMLHGTVAAYAGAGLPQEGDGSFTAALFNQPEGICRDASGNFFVSDYAAHRIRKIAANGTVSTFAGSSAGFANGQFSNPVGLTVDGTGSVYVADSGNSRIVKFSSAGVFQLGIGGGTTWTGAAASPSIGTPNGYFASPQGVTVDSAGNIYVADTNNHRVQKFNSSGSFLLGIGNGTIWTGTASLPVATASNGYFNYPNGIAVDGTGNIYVADTSNNRIQEFNSSGTFVRGWGAGTTWTGTAPAATASSAVGWFTSPTGIAVDSSGNLYVADGPNHRVSKASATGAFATFAGTGTAGSTSGATASALLNNPFGVALDASGDLFVTDSLANIINAVTP